MKPAAYLTSNLLDIIFENRNKGYGAYALRTTYPRRLTKSLAITAFIVITLSLIILLSLFHKHKLITPPPPINPVELSDVKIKEQDPPPVLPPNPPASPKLAAQIKYTQIDIVKDQLARPQEQPPNLDQIQQKAIGLQTRPGVPEGDAAALIGNAINGVTENTKTDKPFITVEQMPHFPGTTTDEESNRQALAFVSKHINYPAVAREQGIQGTVVVQFIIGADGKLTDIHVLGKAPGGGLAEEAVRTVKQMPPWIPGRQNGRNVAVQFVLPIRFTLN